MYIYIGSFSTPATSAPWHRDLTFRHFTSSRPISLTTIWVLDEFNETNNGISILPSTQKHDVFPSYAGDIFVVICSAVKLPSPVLELANSYVANASSSSPYVPSLESRHWESAMVSVAAARVRAHARHTAQRQQLRYHLIDGVGP